RIEAVTEGLRGFVPYRKCGHCDVTVPVNDAGRNFVRAHFAAGRVVMRWATQACVDVHLPCVEYVLGHGGDPAWAVNSQRLATSHEPGGENEIGIADRVIGMHMRQKCGADVRAAVSERLFTVLISSRGASDHTRSKVDQVRRIVDDNCGC